MHVIVVDWSTLKITNTAPFVKKTAIMFRSEKCVTKVSDLHFLFLLQVFFPQAFVYCHKKMKRLALLSFLSFSILAAAYTQESTGTQEVSFKKQGWNLGILPAVSFNTDLGFQYGALANLFHFGDGKVYPDYYHSIYLEASKYTKGSGFFRLYYDSDYLLKEKTIAFDISYLPDDAYDFYGFNGLSSLYHQDWEKKGANDYKSRMFYNYQRQLLRVKATLQSPIKSLSSLHYVVGTGFLSYDIGSVDIKKLNKGKDSEDQLPPIGEQPGLYEKYRDWGLISGDESDGGKITYFKSGVVYDTRNQKINPSNGVYPGIILFGALPELSDHSFLKLSVKHRQYISLSKKTNLTFAYRLGYQTTLAGNTPYYFQTHLISSFFKSALFEGLGGEKSVRGMLRNRLVGDGVGYGNFEIRWIWWSFHLFNQNFYLAFNPFLDAGKITKPIHVKTDKIPETVRTLYYQKEDYPIHLTYGLGLKIAMNENFVLSADYGIATRRQDGKDGFYISMNYLF